MDSTLSLDGNHRKEIQCIFRVCAKWFQLLCKHEQHEHNPRLFSLLTTNKQIKMTKNNSCN